MSIESKKRRRVRRHPRILFVNGGVPSSDIGLAIDRQIADTRSTLLWIPFGGTMRLRTDLPTVKAEISEDGRSAVAYSDACRADDYAAQVAVRASILTDPPDPNMLAGG